MQARHFRAGFTLLEIMIVIAIVGLLAVIAIPNFLKSRTNAQKQICIENLGQIESAKQIWGVENGKNDGDPVTTADLIGPTLYMKKMAECPAGGTYSLEPIGTKPTCTISGHTL
jgi:prepilin-type N-terminal cleavage/methylation domain-containing protein